MSAASDLIEAMEAAAGCRFDDNNGDNNCMAGLVGAMARLSGQTPPTYTERDDIAVGLYIQGQPQREAQRDAIGMLFALGLSPEDMAGFLGGE